MIWESACRRFAAPAGRALAVLLLLMCGCRSGGQKHQKPLSRDRVLQVRAALEYCDNGYAILMMETSLDDQSFTAAVKTLGGPKTAAKALRRYLKTVEAGDEYRLAVLKALGTCGKRGVPGLIDGLTDKAWRVRSLAAYVLAELGPRASGAVPALIGPLGDSQGDVRWCAALALGRIGKRSKRAEPRLKKLLTDDNALICVTAADALYSTGKREHAALIVPVLIRLLNEQDSAAWVSNLCCSILGDLGEAAKEAIPALEKAKEQPGDVGGRAAEALKKIKGEATKSGSKQ
jgi:HEAT repeat protein